MKRVSSMIIVAMLPDFMTFSSVTSWLFNIETLLLKASPTIPPCEGQRSMALPAEKV
jgi:hypothetical protein